MPVFYTGKVYGFPPPRNKFHPLGDDSNCTENA